MEKLISKNLLKHIEQNNFLLASDIVENYSWTGTDKEDLYKQNLKTQPKEWLYRSSPVRYTINSEGYRTKEFKNINWAESVVLFGCSNVYGIGLDDNDTLAVQLENIIGVPVINMGQGGTSVNYNLHNSVILANGYPTPRAVVQIWPSYYRCVFYQNQSIDNCGPWNSDENSYMDVWNKNNSNPKINAIMAQTIFKQIWKNRTLTYECSFSYDSSELFKCQSYQNSDKARRGIPMYQDFARDLLHPGIQTVRRAAKDIASNIGITPGHLEISKCK
jgi:hypothetical protein